MALIEFKDVTKGFLEDRKKGLVKIALRNASLQIEEGEFVCLLGPSGCGKTVSLSMMAGFAKPTSGEVLFRGKPIEGPHPERGVVFQDYSLMPWQTVLGNITFAMKNTAKKTGRPYSKDQAQQRALQVLDSVGLADVANARPNTLSGGMRQRVAIARLLAMDSDVFLMDEPFSALDEQNRAALDQGLHSLWKRDGKTVVFVTHNISEALQLATRILLFSGSPGKVAREWSLSADFDRAPESAEFVALMREIKSCMPSSSASLATGAHAPGQPLQTEE